MRGTEGHRTLFTSDLSVSEFLLTRAAGFEPIGLVLGTSVYHVGYQASRWSVNQEMAVLTQAMYHARELAMSRMEEEAHELGADGVIGVRLEIKRHAWGDDLIEFLAIGTAVVNRKGESGWRQPDGMPFTSDLSGQDFWSLLVAGYRPVSLVMGNCVYHVAHQTIGGWFSTLGQNTELANFTQALYDARELAMERMQAEAVAESAHGIVGAQVHEGHHGWDAHVIEFFAVGTAVMHYADVELPSPRLVLTVNE
jgi:uncharacterized protein YbjQ (UPF0145 family)